MAKQQGVGASACGGIAIGGGRRRRVLLSLLQPAARGSPHASHSQGPRTPGWTERNKLPWVNTRRCLDWSRSFQAGVMLESALAGRTTPPTRQPQSQTRTPCPEALVTPIKSFFMLQVVNLAHGKRGLTPWPCAITHAARRSA